jgi:hypothetical protein
MKTIKQFLGLCLLLTSLQLPGQESKPSEKCIPCEKLISVKLPDVKITDAINITTGTIHCRVRGVIGTEIKFELLLPDTWNGIYVMGGGGGFVGTIQNMAANTVNKGYATSGTDTGHSNEKPDWAMNNMERQVNFGHMAVHRTAEVSKSIIGAYYGSWPKYNYFMGCSRGGGQAMMEAQRYPDDFDGIVAAAPAFNWTAIANDFIYNTQAVYPVTLNEAILGKDQIKMLQDAIVKQCDMIDGISDSILQNPLSCKFDFSALPLCTGNKPGKNCFTVKQIEALKKIYRGVTTANGVTYPGFPYGAENASGSWNVWITGSPDNIKAMGYPSLHSYFGIEIFKYLILQDPEWDYSRYDFSGYEKEIRYAAAYLNATSIDYSRFNAHNGKIIFWHGWNDPALSALATIEHYNAVKAADPGIDKYMKLYLLPGVLHCGGGYGPSEIDWLAIVRDWVEKGIAPGKIVANKTSEGKTVMTREVFPYPLEQ